MKKIFTYIATALIPVLLTWTLGYFKVPDSVDLVDYSAGGAELINSQEQLTSSLKIQVGDRSVEKLSIYNVRFSNNSSKNLQKVQVEFKINAPSNSELVASAVKGPQDYSDSLIKKVSESKYSATYTFDFINVATKNSRDYFTASFLFSGPPPEFITPVSLSPSIGFVDAKENSKADIIVGAVIGIFILLYSALIWWAISTGKKEDKIKQQKFEQVLIPHLASKFSLPHDLAVERTQELVALKDSVFKPENRIKKWLKGWVILPFCRGLRSRNVTQPWPVAALV